MNVTVMVGTFPSVSQQFIFNQIAALIDAGHDVRILASSQAPEADFGGVVAKYQLMERTRFASIPKPAWKRICVGIGKILKLFLVQPRKLIAALNTARYQTAAKGLKTVFYLDLLHRGVPIDLLHCHFGPIGLTGLFLKDTGIAKHLIVTFHGSDINSYPRRHGAGVYRSLWQGADVFTANTSFTAHRMCDYGCELSRIRILPVGLRPSDFPVRSYVEDRSRFIVLFVGRMVEKKGLVYLIDALSMLKERITGLEGWIVGDGPLRAGLEEYARQRGVHSVTRFLGALSGNEVRTLYQRCDIFVLPSVTAASGDMEGQGLVLQEAQATGCPVISTRHNGIPDGVKDGETGLLVPEKDSEALAQAMLALASERHVIANMGTAAAEFVRERYDSTMLNNTLVSIYQTLLVKKADT